MASTSGGSGPPSAASSKLSDVVHVDELHVESDDFVTEVVDVTGGSDDEVPLWWVVDGLDGLGEKFGA